MALPDGFEASFRSTYKGRRLLLNLYVGHARGDFTITEPVSGILRRWLEEISGKFRPVLESDVLKCLRLLEAVLCKLTASDSGKSWLAARGDIHGSRTDLVNLTRLIDVDVLALDARYSLIRRERLLKWRLALGPDDKFDEDLNSFVGSLSGDESALRKGATVRGWLPLSWAAPKTELTLMAAKQSTPSIADRYRNTVATPHEPGMHYLHELDFPPKTADGIGAYRPSFIEAGAQPFFRARTNSPDSCGRTVNLEHLGEGLPNDIGVPEVLLPEVEVDKNFAWRPLGQIRDALPNPDTPEHEGSFTDANMDEALDQAVELLLESLS